MVLIHPEHEAGLITLPILILLPSIEMVFDKTVDSLQNPVHVGCG